MQVRKAFQTPEKLLTTYNPSRQGDVCKTPMLPYKIKTPTLRSVAQAFSRNVIESWLSIQLFDLSEFAGAKEKMNEAQIDELARLITQEYSYLTMAEMMHFFWMFKCGKFGTFYGVIDPLIITEALCEYRQHRNAMMAKVDNERREIQRIRKEQEYLKRLKNENANTPTQRMGD